MSFLAQYWHELQPEPNAKSINSPGPINCEPRRYTDTGICDSPQAESRISAMFADLISCKSPSLPDGYKGRSISFNSAVLEGCGMRGAGGADQRDVE